MDEILQSCNEPQVNVTRYSDRAIFTENRSRALFIVLKQRHGFLIKFGQEKENCNFQVMKYCGHYGKTFHLNT